MRSGNGREDIGPLRAFVRKRPRLRRVAISIARKVHRFTTVTHLKEAAINVRAILRPKDGWPEGKFVVFGQGRSGSSLLLDLLGSHPEVYCEAEIFHRRAHSRLLSPWRYLNGRAALSRRPVYGCQLKVYQMTDDQGIGDVHAFLRDMVEDGWKIVFLTRQDLFRKALSLVVAEARGQFLDRRDRSGSLGRIPIDPDRLIEVMRERGAADEAERRALEGIPHTTVTYEEDLQQASRHQETSDRVLHYLGLESVPVETEFVRTGRARVSEYVENFDELYRALAATDLSACLPAKEEI